MLGALIGGLASIGGSLIGASANKKAAKQQMQMQQRALEIQQMAIQNYLGALMDGYSREEAAIKSGYADQLKALDAGWDEQQQFLDASYNEATGLWDTGVDDAVGAIDDGYGTSANAINSGYDTSIAAINSGFDRQIGEIRAGNEKAQATLNQMRAESAPGYAFLRTLIANPQALTDSQQYQLEKLRANVNNTIRTSSLAGSGRAAAAVFRDTEREYVLGAQDQNRQAAINAAGQLGRDYNAAGTAVAGLQDSLGREVGQVEGLRGTTTATLATNRGTALAGLASNRGTALGNIYARQGEGKAGLAQWKGGNQFSGAGAYASAVGDNAVGQGNALTQISQNLTGKQGEAYLSAGREQAATIKEMGQTQAGATLANGKLASDALGSLGSIIASGVRQSRYN